MDVLDSSTSNREMSSAATTVEDNDVLLIATTLAKEAALLFQSCKFAECVYVLNQLPQKKENDPKVLHNSAIAEYFQDGCSNPKKLLEVLNNVKMSSRELSRVSAEHLEAFNNLGKVTLGSDSSNTMANSTSILYTGEFGACLATLNIAVIWFHLHDYAKALSVLEPLYQNIEPIDETIALHICFLLLDMAVACQDASISADVFTYLEKALQIGYAVSQSDKSNITQQPTNLVAKSSVTSSSSAAYTSNVDSSAIMSASESSLSRTLSDESLEYETELSTLDIGVQNPARTGSLSSSNGPSRTPVAADLKLKMQIYKVRVLLLTRNLKLAKREVKQAINIACGRYSSLALLLKSQLEHACRNHDKAIKLLMASSIHTETGLLSIFNNNLGCIYYQLGKFHMSSVLFSKALSNSSSLQNNMPLKLMSFSQNKSVLISYNCGLQYLACGNPILAARCFQKATSVFYNRPLLWLRLAECCLMSFDKGLLRGDRAPSGRSDIRLCVIGRGKWRHIGIMTNVHVSAERNDSFVSKDQQQPKLSLSLARQFLFNAMHLLNCSESNNLKYDLAYNPSLEENESSKSAGSQNSILIAGLDQINANGDAKEQKGGTSHESIRSSLFTYNDICRRQKQRIKQSLLCNLAYVELELGNHLKALSTAKSLLACSDCSRLCIFLGHVYAAEALIFLNRLNEAAEHLLVYLCRPNNVELPYSKENLEQWQVEKVDCEEQTGGLMTARKYSHEDLPGFSFLKPEEACGTLYANLATMYVLQGNLEQAHHSVVKALSIMPKSSEATLTAVYLDLKLGKSQEAIAKLKQCSQARYFPISSSNNP